MRVFVAGATGAVGKRLVPQLIAGGYDVVAMTRSPQHRDQLRAMGAEPVIADALDRSAVVQAVRRANPEVVIHELTALTQFKNLKRFDEEFALTNRLRTEAVDYLLEGARAVGARRFIAQSYGSWNYARVDAAPRTEEDSIDPTPAPSQVKSLHAIRYLEETLSAADGIEGVALRYANLYGPGTGFARDGDMSALVRKRALPMVGKGAGVWSFIHVEDAASAAVAAIRCGAPGVYNIVDDEPARVNVWLPELARTLGAKPPIRIPVWLGRIAMGDAGVDAMTQYRGMSNAKARRELGWSPRYVSWRQGFKMDLG